MRSRDWKQQRHSINRRAFLRGTAAFAGGASVAVALPFLEGLPERSAFAQSSQPVFGLFICTACGVQQGIGGEPERFWPDQSPGELTTAGMQAYAESRATGVLAAHASRLAIVRGVNFPFRNNGCGHAVGLTQVLTASRNVGTDKDARASGPSADVVLYEAVNPPGVEGLNLYSGMKGGYIDEKLSFKDGGNVRSAEGNPRVVYDRLIDGAVLGEAPASPAPTSGPSIGDLIAMRRNSVNDLVRDELSSLLASSRLSSEDRRRIDQHLTGIRDVEGAMNELEGAATPTNACTNEGLDVDGIRNIGDAYRRDGVIEDVAKLHFDVITLAFACNLNRVATIQIGDGTDGTHYNVAGAQGERFHHISHRIRSDGASGAAISGAVDMHAAIDRLRMGTFKHLLDRWASYSTPSGPMFDSAFALWTNHVADGRLHSFNNVPMIIAGNAGGFLRNGIYVDAGNATNNRLLNTLLTAGGLPTESFGDPELSGGLLDGLVA